jgi:hypothetical protein
MLARVSIHFHFGLLNVTSASTQRLSLAIAPGAGKNGTRNLRMDLGSIFKLSAVSQKPKLMGLTWGRLSSPPA